MDDLPLPRNTAYVRNKVVEDVTATVHHLSVKGALLSKIDICRNVPRSNFTNNSLNTCRTGMPTETVARKGEPLGGASSMPMSKHDVVVKPATSTSWHHTPQPDISRDEGRVETGGMTSGMTSYHTQAPHTYPIPQLSPLDPPNDMIVQNPLELSDLSPLDYKIPYKGEILDDFLGPPSRGSTSNPCQVSKRRDSIDSGSTEYILNEADIELQRTFTGSSCKDAWQGRGRHAYSYSTI